MKLPLFLLGAMLLALCSQAQVPQRFAFQGAARDAAGKAIVNRNVSLRLTIRPTTALGVPVYQETHVTQTSPNGIFNISVGAGFVQSGDFASIRWHDDKFFLQTELDPDGGGNYTDLGATQLLSVPYALHAKEAGRWKNEEPVIQEGKAYGNMNLPPIDWSVFNNKMLWYPNKAAFRFGGWSEEAAWTDANLGNYSFGAGTNVLAGANSFAFGNDVKAVGQYSIAMGTQVEAAHSSLAIGRNAKAAESSSIAIGEDVRSLAVNSIAIGSKLESRSRYGIVFGLGNDISDAVDFDLKPTQRIFQLGNGDEGSEGARRNAVTVLRNGHVGIGSNVLQPTHILDVGNRIRLRSRSGITAGLWLDDNGGAQYCFIGGYDNDHAGIYFEDNGWRFTVHKSGSAFLSGALTQNSDIRLKRDIRPLNANFEKLSAISARHYHWKDQQRSHGLQTGLIAQEVETVFPELVETGKDGYKSVNYIGLIPHLLEAVKELKRENAEMKEHISSLSQQSLSNQRPTETATGIEAYKAMSFLALSLVAMLGAYILVLRRPVA